MMYFFNFKATTQLLDGDLVLQARQARLDLRELVLQRTRSAGARGGGGSSGGGSSSIGGSGSTSGSSSIGCSSSTSGSRRSGGGGGGGLGNDHTVSEAGGTDELLQLKKQSGYC
jgi:hypothetical protein